MGQIYLVASGKGGVGKTTITANVAGCLAKSGNRVLCFDADLRLRNLDILMNKQDEAIFDIQDIYLKRCDFDKALLEHDDVRGLYFIPAPSELSVSESELYKFILKLAREKRDDYDFIFIDCPAGLSSVELLAESDVVLLLAATPDISSVRSAEKAASAAVSSGARARLIVNRVRPELIKKRYAPNIDSVIDDTAVQLIGIIPEDERFQIAASKYELACLGSKKSGAVISVENIAARLCGAEVPLAKLK